MNNVIAGRTHQEWVEDNKEQLKEYTHNYCKHNMEQEHIRHRKSENIACNVCGCQVNINNLARHQRTNTCKSYVKPIDNEEYIIIIHLNIIHVICLCFTRLVEFYIQGMA